MCVRLIQSDPRVALSTALYSALQRNFPRADPHTSNGLPVSPFSRRWLTGPTAGERARDILGHVADLTLENAHLKLQLEYYKLQDTLRAKVSLTRFKRG